MSENVSKTWSSVLVKRIQTSISLDEILFMAHAVKTGEIGLLQWAIMAPLARLKPKPSIEEITKELGIEKVEFLTKTAEELKIMGIVARENDGSYELTELGAQLFNKGKVISGKRKVELSVIYEPLTKEWFSGFSLPSKKNDSQVDEEVFDYDESILDKIRIPLSKLDEHAHKTRHIEKVENVIDYEVIGKKTRSIPVEANVLLRPSGLDIISITSFGDYTTNVSVLLKNKLLKNEKLNEYLADIYDFGSKYPSRCTITPLEIGNAKIYSPAELDKALNNVFTYRPTWVALGSEQFLESALNSRPRVIITTYERASSQKNNLIIPEIVHVHIGNIFKDDLIATDQYTLNVKTVEAEPFKLPILFVEKSDPKFSDILYNELVARTSKGDLSTFNLYLARLYLRPTRENYDHVCKYLENHLRGARQSEIVNSNYISDLFKLKGTITDKNMSNVEKQLFLTILKAYSIDDLLNLDGKIIESIDDVYSLQVIDRIKTDLSRSNIKDIVSNYNILNGKLKKISNKNLSTKFLKALNEAISSTVLKLDEICADSTEQNINLAFGLANIVSNKDLKIKTATFLKKLIKRGEYAPDKVESWYVKLADCGLNFSDEDIKAFCDNRLKGFELDLLKDGNYKTIKSVNYLVKKLQPAYAIERSVSVPPINKTGKISNKNDIRILFENISELNSILPGIKNNWLREQLSVYEKALRDVSDSKNIELWLGLIEKGRNAQKKDKFTYLDIRDEDVIKILSSVELANIEKNKNLLKSIGLYEALKNATKRDKNIRKPPIDRIVIDGSNVAGYSEKYGEDSVYQLIRAYVDLKEIGFKEIYVIVGAKLRHYLKEEFNSIKKFYDDESIKTNYTVMQQAPAGTSDDHFVIIYANKLDALILSNDLYRDYKDKYPEFRSEIDRRLVKYMFDPKNSSLVISEYPEYDKEAVP